MAYRRLPLGRRRKPEAVDQFSQPLLRIPEYRHSVTDEDCVEVESDQLRDAAPQSRRIVHNPFAQQAEMPGRIPDNRVAHDQSFSLRPKKCNLAGTLSSDAYCFESAYPFTLMKFTVNYCALRFRVRGVLGMHVRTGPGAL